MLTIKELGKDPASQKSNIVDASWQAAACSGVKPGQNAHCAPESPGVIAGSRVCR